MKWGITFGIGLLVFVGIVSVVLFSPQPATAPEQAEPFAREPAGSVGRNLISVYDGVSVSSDVTVLDLSGRGLTGSLKAEVRQLTNLEVLDLSNNQFTGLPAEVGQLTDLQILNLAGNPLTGLPLELGNLQNLRTLDLRGTEASEFDLNIIRERLPATTNVITGAYFSDETEELITVSMPTPGTEISSPVAISGEARGPWYFEGDFPVVLVDWDGLIIAEGFATADGEWMTESFVPFSVTLSYTSPYTEGDPEFMRYGTLILQRSNPSGLPEYDRAIEVPIRFSVPN